MTDTRTTAISPLYVLFFFSGIAGLIYESVWSHYLKLLLGHAALAQTLVLVIFMGGMAIGAAALGRLSKTLRRPLLIYAVIEGLLGIAGLLFDPIYRGASAYFYDTLAPMTGNTLALPIIKWTLASALILPQSILLGATFPLLSAGVCRIAPEASGRVLSMLYFTNSLGAVLGVLLSGFVLIRAVGLPGTIMTAALLNCLLGLIVWLCYGKQHSQALATTATAAGHDQPRRLLLLTAFATGMASFFYEIGWIRMLSLVLGSSTHSFELMLAAFIFGLAAGALAIRGRIDTLRDPILTLGLIQLVMGALAMATLWLYMSSFDWMIAILGVLQRTAEGYVAFNLASNLICFALMLPATFCAGMTLPLITRALLLRGAGEASIGNVYAVNTLGAIAGTVAAINLVMPALGLRAVVVFGGVVDMIIGLMLLATTVRRPRLGIAAAAAALVLLAGLTAPWDEVKLSSGVFRYGEYRSVDEILYHRDGRTATVSVIRAPSGALSISTNGKVDGALSATEPTPDETTTTLLGLLPMAFKPDATEVAVIGFGSGRTTHVLLSEPGLQRVDTIEIEPAMVEGARLFGAMNEAAYADPRSNIVIDDAKTYFVSSQNRYDAIISEPSNPWVSGVASLFSVEFYRQMRDRLKPGGVLAQWIQGYEIDALLVSSIMQAIDQEFADYQVYAALSKDLIVIASTAPLPATTPTVILDNPAYREALQRIHVTRPGDLSTRLIGRREQLGPLFQALGAPVNSDYFPFLDQHAAQRRFENRDAGELEFLIPISLNWRPGLEPQPVTPAAHGIRSLDNAHRARELVALLHQELPPERQAALTPALLALVGQIRGIRADCDAVVTPRLWAEMFNSLGNLVLPYLDRTAISRLGDALRERECVAAEMAIQPYLDWLDALASDSPGEIVVSARALGQGWAKIPDWLAYRWLLAARHAGGRVAMRRELDAYGARFSDSILLRALGLYARSSG